jgi:hypothetical protein
MNRYAVLIGSGNAAPPLLQGPAVDVRRLKTWMMHNNGGAWEESEIAALVDPTVAQIAEAIDRAGRADYAFVAFSGHGGIEQDSRTGYQVQKIIVGNNLTYDFLALTPKSKKSTLVCDACRVVEQVVVFNERVEKSIKFARAKVAATRAMYRTRFEAAVTAAAEGVYTMYGCAVGQYCYDAGINGGFFTGSLIDNAAAWCDRVTASQCLAMHEVLSMAAQAVSARTQNLTPPQHPNGGPQNKTLGNPFPFAVALV